MRIERIWHAALLLTVAVYTAGLGAAGVVALLVLSLGEVLSRSWRWVRTGLDLPLAGLVLAVLGSFLASEWRAATVTLVAYFLLTVLVSVRPVAAYVRGGVDRTIRLLVIWAAGGIVAAVWGLARSYPAGFTLASTMVIGHNTLGTTVAVAAILTLSLFMSGALRRRWVWTLGLAVLFAGLIATWARAAWLGAAAGVLTLMIVGAHPRARLALALGCAGLILLGAATLPRLPVLAAEIRSIASLEANRNRIFLWESVPRIVADHPFLGTGFGTFIFAYPRYRRPDAPEPNPPFAHNIFLTFAAETGLLGLAAFSGLCASALAATWRWLARSPPASPGRAAATAVLAALVTMLTNQLFDDTAVTVHSGFGLLALFAVGATGERYLLAGDDRGARAAGGSRPGTTTSPAGRPQGSDAAPPRSRP